MSQELYYTAPPDEAFEEMKKVCMGIWGSYDDTHGYAAEKKNRIKDMENVQDNFMYMLAMFDAFNQRRVLDILSEETLEEVHMRAPNLVQEIQEAIVFFNNMN